MKYFFDIQNTWNQIKTSMNIASIIQEKIFILLQDKSKEGVASCFNLLLSFGDESICEVLQEEDGQLLLRDDVHIEHPFLWFGLILAYCEESNDWKNLVDTRAFSKMENLLFSHLKKKKKIEQHEQQRFMKKELQKMYFIPKGAFMMGALPRDKAHLSLETPRHDVIMNTGFWMGKYPVTKRLYIDIMGSSLENSTSHFAPVEHISWCDAIIFCNRISEIEGLQPAYSIPSSLKEACSNQKKKNNYKIDTLSHLVEWNKNTEGYRLPTEAEWEYAARGGEEHLYAGSEHLIDVAWYGKNHIWGSKPVGEKQSNGFGLYDMSGNVWEWVWDSAFREYASTPSMDPIYKDEDTSSRVYRGGCRGARADSARLSYRHSSKPSSRTQFVGFRIARGARL